jgi:hypothetical protein
LIGNPYRILKRSQPWIGWKKTKKREKIFLFLVDEVLTIDFGWVF